MKKISFCLLYILLLFNGYTQTETAESPVSTTAIVAEIAHLKELVKELQESQLQSEKLKYQKNYQVIINGIEILKEMQQGVLEISGARSQNMLYKKLIDINNPTSETLGFQLQDVVMKSIEDNISILPLLEPEKRRLKDQLSNFMEGVKRTFPPIQLVTGIFSSLTSFNSYKARIAKVNRKADSVLVDVIKPINKEFLTRVSNQLQPYLSFYSELDKVNSSFENALYQHEIEYRDYMEEVQYLNDQIAGKINLNNSISGQIIALFDLTNSSSPDFDFKAISDQEQVKELVGYCANIFEMVERYKKFTNDFIIIQDDFYRKNLSILETTAKNLPVKDVAKIDQLIEDLNLLKNGNPATNTQGFDTSYKQRLKSILMKLYTINKIRD